MVRLKKREVIILQALARHGSMSRQQLNKECKASSILLGAATRDNLGLHGGGLEGKGFLVAQKVEGERQLQYVITPAGRKALRAALQATARKPPAK